MYEYSSYCTSHDVIDIIVFAAPLFMLPTSRAHKSVHRRCPTKSWNELEKKKAGHIV